MRLMTWASYECDTLTITNWYDCPASTCDKIERNRQWAEEDKKMQHLVKRTTKLSLLNGSMFHTPYTPQTYYTHWNNTILFSQKHCILVRFCLLWLMLAMFAFHLQSRYKTTACVMLLPRFFLTISTTFYVLVLQFYFFFFLSRISE